MLIDVVFNDLKPATKQLFQSAWHEPTKGSGFILQVIETICDYMSDWQQFLNLSILDLLIEDLLDAFLDTYLDALAKRVEAQDGRRDRPYSGRHQRGVPGFQHTETETAKELEAYFEVIELVLALLEASKDLVFLSFKEFAKVHSPNLAFVEGLRKARDDLDRSAVSEVMDRIKRRVKEDGISDRECKRPTVAVHCLDSLLSQRLSHDYEEDHDPEYIYAFLRQGVS